MFLTLILIHLSTPPGIADRLPLPGVDYSVPLSRIAAEGPGVGAVHHPHELSGHRVEDARRKPALRLLIRRPLQRQIVVHYRNGEPVPTTRQMPLNILRRSCTRCLAWASINVGHGTKYDSASSMSL